jgi:hypothetical protein
MLQICNTNVAYFDKISIFGERHSGTNFLENCFKQKFGLERTSYFDNKHFFGWCKPETITYHRMSLHTLFTGIVRNPYDWIMAMINLPHHIHPHRLQNIESFLLSEWYSTDFHHNEILTDRNYQTKNRYKNIFEMRTLKYKYLSEIMPVIAKNYMLLSYDSFLKNYHNYLNIISNRFYLKKIGQEPELQNKNPYQVPEYIKNIIDNNVDWSLEESLGFYKRV